MGSDSDFPALESAVKTLKAFGVEVAVHVISAHRSPKRAEAFAASAAKEGFEVILAAAGKAAHLAGVLAANTPLPIIGIPIKASLGGLDALLSTVQMPDGIPVATVAINGAKNAALLAIQMLSLKYPELQKEIIAFKEGLAAEVERKDAALQEAVDQI